MQHTLKISRKIDYGLRAMIFLASIPSGDIVPFREIARRMQIPEEFAAKILKTLSTKGLVKATRGKLGGYSIAKPMSEISFLDVIEAVEGPVVVNLCLSRGEDTCKLTPSCTMYSVWKEGQERMLEVYREATLDKLVIQSLPPGLRAVLPRAEKA
ncbi:MAG TPA: Rrf2 family transcriptional regulator [Myxococcales bacterium]|jgi:Rrf2 family protein